MYIILMRLWARVGIIMWKRLPGSRRVACISGSQGTEDVMWVRPVTGSRREAPSACCLQHKLTQLRFRLVDDEREFAGVTVTGLAFNGVNTASTLNLEDGRTEDGLPRRLPYRFL